MNDLSRGIIINISGEPNDSGAEVGSAEGASLEGDDEGAGCGLGYERPYLRKRVGCRPPQERTDRQRYHHHCPG